MDSLDSNQLHKLYEKRKKIIIQLVHNMQYSQDLDKSTVFEPYNPKNRELVYDIVEDYIHPQSTIININHLEELFNLAKQGHSCIIMSEHYSNFDSIGLYYIVRKKYPNMLPLFENLVFLAASKLNTEHKMVLAFSESMSRLIIHQAREKEKNNSIETDATLLASIAKRSFQKMQELKKQGNIIFMFPSGTRFREDNPNSRKAIHQTASFLKRFDYVCFLGIKGNVLKVNSSQQMLVDELYVDALVYHASVPQKCSDIIAQAKNTLITTHQNNQEENKALALKEQVSQFVTEYLLSLHEKATVKYNKIMNAAAPSFIGKIL